MYEERGENDILHHGGKEAKRAQQRERKRKKGEKKMLKEKQRQEIRIEETKKNVKESVNEGWTRDRKGGKEQRKIVMKMETVSWKGRI